MKNNYLVIEGNIGSGKISFANKLPERFNTKLILERFDINPFLPLFYEIPSKYAFPLELFFLAERYKQLKEELPNFDLFKTSTISDYFHYKSLIFAKLNLLDDEYHLYQRLFNKINGILPKPDLLVYLYSDFERLKKIKNKKDDPMSKILVKII